MLIYIIGNIIFGFIPLSYGAVEMVKYSYTQYKRNVSFGEWQDFPIKLAIVAVCLQFQLIGLFYGIKLVKTWRGTGVKNN